MSSHELEHPRVTPELEAGARAMYERLNQGMPLWTEQHQNVRDHYCQAFVAGLNALLPVRDAVKEAMGFEDMPPDFRNGQKWQFAKGEEHFTAAIRHITKGDA